MNQQDTSSSCDCSKNYGNCSRGKGGRVRKCPCMDNDTIIAISNNETSIDALLIVMASMTFIVWTMYYYKR